MNDVSVYEDCLEKYEMSLLDTMNTRYAFNNAYLSYKAARQPIYLEWRGLRGRYNDGGSEPYEPLNHKNFRAHKKWASDADICSVGHDGFPYDKYTVMPTFLDERMMPTGKPTDALWCTTRIILWDKPAHYIDENTNIPLPQLLKYIKLNGEQVLCAWVKVNGYYIPYIYLPYLPFNAVKTSAYVGSCIVGNKRASNGIKQHDWYSVFDTPAHAIENVRIHTDIHIMKQQFPREKITQDHHTLLRPEEIISSIWEPYHIKRERSGKILEVRVRAMNDERLIAIDLLITKAVQLGINTEAAISTFMLYITLTPLFAVRLLTTIISVCKTALEFRTTLKAEGIISKQLQHLRRSDLNYVFELNVLINRLDTKVDWQDERIKRTTGLNVVEMDPSEVRNMAKSIFKDGLTLGKKATNMDWKTYWATRWARMPTGSFISQYNDDINIKQQCPIKGMANKTSVLSNMGNRKFTDFFNRQPELFAKTSTKYEWGKVRALFGCDITSYLMADFAMSNCEETLPAYFPVGKAANDKYVKHVMDRMSQGTPVCYDFDDFNSQHSTSSMIAVIAAWHDVYGHMLSDEQQLAVMWTINSIKNMRTYWEDIEAVTETYGTLYSGWRHTSFINTVLNRVYLEKAGLKKTLDYAIHNGDDMYGVSKSVYDALQLIKHAENMGVRAQVSKMNIGTIAEFLRVDGRARDETGAQYLTRACATAVHSRVEAAAISSLRAGVEATITRTESLVARGADKHNVSKIEETILLSLYRQFGTDYNTHAHYITLHPVQGGRNVDAEVSKYRIVDVVRPSLDRSEAQYVSYVDRGGQDYLNYLANQYDVDITTVDRNIIRAINRMMVKGAKTSMCVSGETRRNALYYMINYKTFSNTKDIAHITKAKLLGQYGLHIPSEGTRELWLWMKRTGYTNQIASYLF